MCSKPEILKTELLYIDNIWWQCDQFVSVYSWLLYMPIPTTHPIVKLVLFIQQIVLYMYELHIIRLHWAFFKRETNRMRAITGKGKRVVKIASNFDFILSQSNTEFFEHSCNIIWICKQRKMCTKRIFFFFFPLSFCECIKLNNWKMTDYACKEKKRTLISRRRITICIIILSYGRNS